MGLAALIIDDLRCIERVSLELHPRHTLIWGENAAGKTSVLEAAYLLGRGRSFRTRSSQRLIRHGADQLVVFGRTDSVPERQLGVQVSRSAETIAKVDGCFTQSLAELSQALAVQVIDPGVHRLIEEGGYRRRRWLDWGVFHVEPLFLSDWGKYTRALRQRNAALKSQPEVASAWDIELTRLGETIATARGRFLKALEPTWLDLCSRLVERPVELSYARGWPQSLSYAEALRASGDRDRSRGTTHVGPHRADVTVKLDGKLGRDVLSRGQQKLTAIAMTLAQLQLLQETVGMVPTLLLDDPAAELDSRRLSRFTEEVSRLRCQLIVTSLSAGLDPLGSPDTMFHVEQGHLV